MSDREAYRAVEPGDENIKFALKWAEPILRQWLQRGDAALIVSEPRRTLDQNAKMWPMLQDLARQVDWFVDGQPRKLSKEEWKDMMTAGLKKQHVAPSIDGTGFVVLGTHTSTMTKREFSDLVEVIYSFGAERNVVWSEPAKRTIDEHKKRRAA